MYLTRNGSFVPDASGYLVNSAGYYLMGSNIQGGRRRRRTRSAACKRSMSRPPARPPRRRPAHRSRPTCLRRRRRSPPPICPRPIRRARPIPTKPRSSSTTISAERTRSTFISATRAPTPGKSTPSTRPTAASGGGFPFSSGPLATHAHLQPDQRNLVLRLAAHVRGSGRADGHPRPQPDHPARRGLQRELGDRQWQRSGEPPGRLDRVRTGRSCSSTPTAPPSRPTTSPWPTWRAPIT